MQWALVFVFGGLGAVTRVGVAHFFPVRALPWGTLLVNVAGCLAIGALYHFFESRPPLVGPWRVALIGGFLGGFTTFSTFSNETLNFLRGGEQLLAAINIGAQLIGGLGAVWLGRALAYVIWR